MSAWERMTAQIDVERLLLSAGNGLFLTCSLIVALALYRRSVLLKREKGAVYGVFLSLVMAISFFTDFGRGALFQTNFVLLAAGMKPIAQDQIRFLAALLIPIAAFVAMLHLRYILEPPLGRVGYVLAVVSGMVAIWMFWLVVPLIVAYHSLA